MARYRKAGSTDAYEMLALGESDDRTAANGETSLDWKQALDKANAWFELKARCGVADPSTLTVDTVVDEYIKMRDARDSALAKDISGDVARVIILLAATGARFSQIPRMRVEDVQIASSRLMVPKSRKGRGKVSGYIRMPVGQDVLAAIRPILAGRDAGESLLERWYHKRVGWNGFDVSLQQARKQRVNRPSDNALTSEVIEIATIRSKPGGMEQLIVVGEQLRTWRQRRRMSQLELACEAEISTRHLSFLETGRASPSREMVLHLAERLSVPVRARNRLLIAAGFAPIYSERPLSDVAMIAAREAIGIVLDGQRPFPAFALDRLWNIVASNGALPELFEGVAAHLLTPPMNAIRLSLHPEGLAPRIRNLREWGGHLLERLRHQLDQTADPALQELLQEAEALIASHGGPASRSVPSAQAILLPLVIDTPVGTLSLLSTTMVFGTPIDVTLSELAIESFLPADADTAARIRAASAEGGTLPPA